MFKSLKELWTNNFFSWIKFDHYYQLFPEFEIKYICNRNLPVFVFESVGKNRLVNFEFVYDCVWSYAMLW